MHYRHLDRSETDVLAQAAGFERDFPPFYRDSSNTWTADEEDVLRFYESCSHLYGVWTADELIALIYFEQISRTHFNVHLDAKRGADRSELVAGCKAVRDDRFRNGTLSTETWALTRNRAIRRLLGEVGFRETGLRMKAGHSHGRVLSWTQMRIVRPV